MKRLALCHKLSSKVLSKVLGIALAMTVISSTGGLPLTLTAAASEPVAATQVVAPLNVYVTRAGDTLWAIARRYGITVDELMIVNGLRTTTIYIGQQLVVPPDSPEQIYFAQGATATTVKGSLSGPQPKYILRASAGQTMTLRTSGATAGIQIAVEGRSDGVIYKALAEDYAGDPGRWQGRLPMTQDYLLTLSPGINTKLPVDYSLLIQIEGPVVQPTRPVAAFTCDWEGALRSQNSAVASSVDFLNTTSDPVNLYWLNYQGDRVFYATVAGGATFSQQSYSSHPWLVTNDQNQCLAIFVAQEQPGRAVIARG